MKIPISGNNSPCSTGAKECGCHSISRRTFIAALSGGIAAATMLNDRPVMAGPFENADFAKLIPPDKKLRPEWVKSLFERGDPAVYSKGRGELQFIGMPVGGLCCGTVYLGGDGKLWLWDIFNQNPKGIEPRNVSWNGFGYPRDVNTKNGANYVSPANPESPFEQGFILRLNATDRPMDARGWQNITFRGNYPVGEIFYTDPDCPVTVKLEAYSPFIPLNTDDSSLPVTICEFSVTNPGDKTLAIEMAGFLQNACSLFSVPPRTGSRVNTVKITSDATILSSSLDMEMAAGYSGHQGPGAKADSLKVNDPDLGTMAMAILGKAVGKPNLAGQLPFDAPEADRAEAPAEHRLIGGLVQSVRLAPGQSQTITFAIAWHFPNTGHLPIADASSGNYYAKRFADAAAVVDHVMREYPRLSHDTKLWRDTWYDSTLPYWFLDRTAYNTACLATSTSHRFGTGLYWGWEGVGCCFGTCTHVYHFAQATARLFPDLERILRRRTDFGAALDKTTGMIGYRGPGTGPAVDGQAGMILCALREHQMSADDAFLQAIWPGVRLAIGWLMNHTDKKTGLINGPQPNTLDAPWYGQIAWISGLYAAALQAGVRMATDMGDDTFAAACTRNFARTKKSLETKLFNGEYFIQKSAPGRSHLLGAYKSSFIEQVHGQTWAWQIGLSRVFDRAKTVSALKALYKYNFTLNVGPFRMKNPAGRPYALAGDGGLIMATNPKGLPDPFGNTSAGQYGYFDECMSGFEHQAASIMLSEGLLLEGLAVTRAIDDRYSARLRNPFNEIECSDHYSRSMASYGTFISICGFEYHGPKGHIGFLPRLKPENFKAAFTSAQGWGTFSLRQLATHHEASLNLRWGKLKITTLALPAGKFSRVAATLNGRSIDATLSMTNEKSIITFRRKLTMNADQVLMVTLS